MKLSLCMIVKDEESVLARCLDSVRAIADEIIIVDTGSTDGTKQIAKRYTDHVISYTWQDNFSAARNFAFSKATGDYLMWLDADDYLPPSSAAQLLKLKDELETNPADVVMCPYDTALDANGKPTYSYMRERILKREAEFRFEGRVHECIAPHGKIIDADVHIQHLGSKKIRGTRNLRIYQRQISEEVNLSPRDMFYYGRELYYNRLYAEAIAVLEEFLQSNGWYVNKIEACKVCANCYLAKGNKEKAYSTLFQSFRYGEPRAGVLCEIAKLYQSEQRLREAIFWYESAIRCRSHLSEGDFEDKYDRSLTPILELVYCCYHSGDVARAVEWHKKSEECEQSHPSVVYNRKFFTTQGLLQ